MRAAAWNGEHSATRLEGYDDCERHSYSVSAVVAWCPNTNVDEIITSLNARISRLSRSSMVYNIFEMPSQF